MRLNERLEQLHGRHVKIGGGVGTASGFFYCGPAFYGIGELMKELSRDEEARISNLVAKATKIYNERDARWTVRVRTAENDFKVAEQAVEAKRATMDALASIVRRAQRLAEKVETKKVKSAKAQRILRKYRSRLEVAKFELAIAQKDLQRKDSVNKTLHTSDAKDRQYRAWKKARDNYRAELSAFKTLADTEVIEDRPSLDDPRVRILIIKSSINGQYWFEEECDDDIKMQWKVRRARRGREDDF